ncbi:branched-chain amino acid transport system substrate-binding protein [Palleronia aestuarii]|uniref:Branched-chain amino acid transport system substrate-binding protein n=1 Tax=Palleronia aestuarii TaxID=568105 RepID=A0A2W7NNU7_9RHOB|nr:ABC transporter substrate-binding protein [Palleronia aestuarii]PZX14916.1 branched-chain amino acid transport system substrate-binding protein [Palleronia aestuarii]
MKTRTNRRLFLQGGTAGLALGLAAPTYLRAQSGPLKIGHLTPLTGFLGPLGEYGQMGVDLALEEINANGGVGGRQIELLKEDSVNAQTASTKAERMFERDGVEMILGEISSASCLTISQVAARYGKLFVNTGGNSDALRGSDCNRYMFHVETENAMYVNAEGRYFQNEGLVDGKDWYTLNADYAFGHDLLRAAKSFLEANGGNIVAEEMVPTDATDFSSYLLKIRQVEPDVVALNLAGTQITNFFKQYGEFGLDFTLGGFGFDTVAAWAAGARNFRGTWPNVWNHLVDTEESKSFTKTFTDKYGKPPENQAWGDYNALKIVAQGIDAIGGANGDELIAYFESDEAKFDVQKTRQAYFRPEDHQLIQEIYAITALDPDAVENEWDIFTTSGPIPGEDQPLDVLAQSTEGACTFSS